MTLHLYRGDLPGSLDLGSSVAVDTETQGLSLVRDRLCLVQLSTGDGEAHIVQLDRSTYDCPNLKALLSDPGVEKILHFARFDMAVIRRDLDINLNPVFCTKIASRLVRTYTDRHGLKEVAREIADVELSKQQQSSDWAAADLTEAQLQYAASDVLHLHAIRDGLTAMLEREGRLETARACFEFLPTRVRMDLMGWADTDIFAHA